MKSPRLRNATFGATPHIPEGPMFASFPAARDRARAAGALALVALIDHLDALQRDLVYEDDCQEAVDANLNGAQFLRAAGHLDFAEPHVLELVELLT